MNKSLMMVILMALVSAIASAQGTVIATERYYGEGVVVKVEAVPDAGWVFSHWEGALTGSINPTTITMNADQTVRAVFIEEPATTLTINLNGYGSVTPNPTGPDYVTNTLVTLTATADPGWRFDHWEGDLTGSINPTTITMDTDKTVTAVFVEIPIVSLTLNTMGSGSVNPNPAGPDYYQGTVVTVTATAGIGWAFDHWEGDLTGSTNPTTVAMDTSKTATAVFVEIPVNTPEFRLLNNGGALDASFNANGVPINTLLNGGLAANEVVDRLAMCFMWPSDVPNNLAIEHEPLPGGLPANAFSATVNFNGTNCLDTNYTGDRDFPFGEEDSYLVYGVVRITNTATGNTRFDSMNTDLINLTFDGVSQNRVGTNFLLVLRTTFALTIEVEGSGTVNTNIVP